MGLFRVFMLINGVKDYEDLVAKLTDLTITELLTEILSTPTGAIVTFIQFLLGLALGYITAKIFKYIIAMIAILILGSFLSVWSIGSLSGETLSKLGVTLETLKNIVLAFLTILVGPIAIGFIVGVIIGFLKK
jgi:uncharacterized membrane protein (Fun14 family)